jgi:succinoglycan biosynthesis protein ExoV
MNLIYHEGRNFGDALNPMIMEHFLPNFFDGIDDVQFLGIGSILGLKRPAPTTRRVVVFSSGYGGGDPGTYGELPTPRELEMYDFRCVRGALTAELLNLDKRKAICDGAILLPLVLGADRKTTTGTIGKGIAFMPHVSSLVFNPGLPELLGSVDIRVLDPRDDVQTLIEQIASTKTLYAEAMHGAIVADSLRVPWVPVHSNKSINAFKWNDFCQSMGVQYAPNYTSPLFSTDFLTVVMRNKTKIPWGTLNRSLALGYRGFQSVVVEKRVLKFFKNLESQPRYLSTDNQLSSKQDQLQSCLNQILLDYG